MGRKSTQAVPANPPDEAHLRWLAELFASGRAAFTAYSTTVALRVHAKDEALLEQLVDAFGGRASPYAGTNRWLLYGEPLRAALDGIRPLLSGTGLQRLLSAEAILFAEVSNPVFVTEQRAVQLLGKRRAARAAAAASAAVPAEDAPPSAEIPAVAAEELEISGNVPPGPWADDEPLLQAVGEEGMHLHARGVAEGEAFVLLAQRFGLLADLVQCNGRLVVRLAVPPPQGLAS
jgi:hypothetical protein